MSENKLKNEILVTCFDKLIFLFYWLNVVEYVKIFMVLAFQNIKDKELSEDEKRAASGVGIDLYQILKFSIVITLLSFDIRSVWSEYLAYYLIFSNAFTYFYYHAWGSQYVQLNDRPSQRRRLLNFLLAIIFYILCYAYLYKYHFCQSIAWPEGIIDTTNAIYLSVANAFTMTYGDFSPKDQIVRVLFMTELANTFLFFTVIVSNSIPSIKREE